ncbi:hypothetical protein FKG94_01070 [Exilibacterium tricleocarpae]|uniref:Cytochrome c-type biogenesis protein n=1 Tax=Exilibacterium tricleocarpae TaxID=2591008 RepID=A0A545U9M4_9GAMM|nr:hypothetical protein [Exilibacterium tricleocarpae]TQV86176.1 hypothetical protein FKG94_01070 [Exilibacterium tricleocarpae]
MAVDADQSVESGAETGGETSGDSKGGGANVTLLYAAIGVLLLIVGLLGGYLLAQTGQPAAAVAPLAQTHAQHAAHGSVNLNLPAELTQFMSGWGCPCGCGDPLLECHCSEPNGAEEIRGYVKNLYDDDIPLEVIRDRVIKRYGASVVGGL